MCVCVCGEYVSVCVCGEYVCVCVCVCAVISKATLLARDTRATGMSAAPQGHSDTATHLLGPSQSFRAARMPCFPPPAVTGQPWHTHTHTHTQPGPLPHRQLTLSVSASCSLYTHQHTHHTHNKTHTHISPPGISFRPEPTARQVQPTPS